MTTGFQRGGSGDALVEYKRVLEEVLNNRPSGTRMRLATALGKNRSFISQISNPLYPTPIPAIHLRPSNSRAGGASGPPDQPRGTRFRR